VDVVGEVDLGGCQHVRRHDGVDISSGEKS